VDLLTARQTGVVDIDGKRCPVVRGRTIAHPEHPIARDNPRLWAPLKLDYPQPAADAGPSSAEVRAWAAEQGIDVPRRGRLPEAVVEAYMEAVTAPSPPE
jgi:hypothetical protein